MKKGKSDKRCIRRARRQTGQIVVSELEASRPQFTLEGWVSDELQRGRLEQGGLVYQTGPTSEESSHQQTSWEDRVRAFYGNLPVPIPTMVATLKSKF